MSISVFIATSLDGFIATSDGGVEWLNDVPNPDGGDFGYAEFIGAIDAVVMGRHTFEKVLTFGQWVYHKPVFVLSTTLTAPPEELAGKAKILGGDPKSVVRQLDERGLSNLYVDGGMLIQSFLREDLVDHLILTRVPILLGGGIPLFGDLDDPLSFDHVKTEVLNDYLVQSHYSRAG